MIRGAGESGTGHSHKHAWDIRTGSAGVMEKFNSLFVLNWHFEQ